MATIVEPVETRASVRRVAGPLDRLRGLIRLYVALEAAALVVLYVAIWFWVGLALDYGFFALFAVDWVQELPRGFRTGILAALTGGLAVLLLVQWALRWFRDLRPRALALVLERRFAGELGDRLITAVELGERDIEGPYGYSPLMLEETVRQAAERTERIPIHEALDWRRLRRRWLVAAACLVLPYLLVGAFACSYRWESPTLFLRQFNDTAVIWFERNILLRDTLWPRRALLELLNEPFVAGDEMRVGRDAPPTALRVRAWKWVIADDNRKRAPEGWRPLLWSDVSPELLGEPVDESVVPAAWRHWPVDQIELALDRPDGHRGLNAQAVSRIEEWLHRLHEQAGLPGMSRRFRELIVPQEAVVHYRGAATRSEQTLQRQAGNEYSGAADVKESVRFTVSAENYYTPWKRLTLVPPPVIVELLLQEDQPAYLYHRLPRGGTRADLAGKRQHFPARPVSLTGDTSRIDVPLGTDVVLTARTDKPLRSPDGVHLAPPRKRAPEVSAPVEQPEAQSFRVRFAHVNAALDFVFRYQDTDGVLGTRHVIIRPMEDLPPEVDVQVEVLRRTHQGYLATAQAQIPLSGRVRDDHGLDAVDYVYTLTRLASGSEGGATTAFTASGIGLGAGGALSALAGMPFLTMASAPISLEQEQPAERLPLETFQQLIRERARRDPSPEELRARLQTPPQEPLLKDYTLDPEREAFDVTKLGLRMTDEKAVQPKYRLRLWVVATDNNIETGPRTAESKDKFTITIVSENELLGEIAKEEESLRIKLEEAVGRLKDGKIKLTKLGQDLPDLKPDEFSPVTRRSEEIGEGVVRSWDTTRDVYNDYRHILKELQVNRVQAGMISRVNDKIYEPLDGAINLEFVQADEAVRALQKKLEAHAHDLEAVTQAGGKLDKLIARLSTVLDAMADVTSINRLIETLIKIEKAERDELSRLERLKKQKGEDILDRLSEPKKP